MGFARQEYYIKQNFFACMKVKKSLKGRQLPRMGIIQILKPKERIFFGKSYNLFKYSYNLDMQYQEWHTFESQSQTI